MRFDPPNRRFESTLGLLWLVPGSATISMISGRLPTGFHFHAALPFVACFDVLPSSSALIGVCRSTTPCSHLIVSPRGRPQQVDMSDPQSPSQSHPRHPSHKRGISQVSLSPPANAPRYRQQPALERGQTFAALSARASAVSVIILLQEFHWPKNPVPLTPK